MPDRMTYVVYVQPEGKTLFVEIPHLNGGEFFNVRKESRVEPKVRATISQLTSAAPDDFDLDFRFIGF